MISTAEKTILRELAKRVADIAALPIMNERRARWKRHNALKAERPLVLVFPEGAWDELVNDRELSVSDPILRHWEWILRSTIYEHEHFACDRPISRRWVENKIVWNTGWGLDPHETPSSQSAKGARHYEQVLTGIADLAKMRYPEVKVDEQESSRRFELARELFGDILDVEQAGVAHVSFHLMGDYMRIRGHEQAMLDFYMEPQLVHDTMAFFEEGNHRLVRQYCDLNLLSLNNNGAYHSSGGIGYTDELPAPGFNPARVRPIDMWASAESQELAAVSPEHHEQFAAAYERRLLEPFGLNGYGCCEPLHDKLDFVLTMPRMRRVSISPWADIEKSAAKLGGRCIFSWKPHPAHLVGGFDPQRVRAYIRNTVDIARAHGCVLELILKDTHTCEHSPERFTQWTEIAMEEVSSSI